MVRARRMRTKRVGSAQCSSTSARGGGLRTSRRRAGQAGPAPRTSVAADHARLDRSMTSVARMQLADAAAGRRSLDRRLQRRSRLLLRGAASRFRLRGCDQRKFAQQESRKITAQSFTTSDSGNNGHRGNANIFCLLKFRIHYVSVLYLRLIIPEAAHAMRLVSA